MPSSYFITDSNLPELRRPKYIVAVCGITADVATPDTDEWLLNDFFFLAHTLHGGEGSRIWLTCISPDLLVERYAVFAAENGFDSRLPGCVRICSEGDLHSALSRETQRACREAEKNILHENGRERSVLVVVLGHGNIKTRGIEVGRQEDIPEPSPQDYLDMEVTGQRVVSPYWLVRERSVECIAQQFFFANISLMVPEYHGGSWRYYPDVGFQSCHDSLHFDRIEGTVFSHEIGGIYSELDISEEEFEDLESVFRAILLNLFVEGKARREDRDESAFSSGEQRLRSGKLSNQGGEQMSLPRPGPPWEEQYFIDYLPLSSSLLDRVGGSQSALHRLLQKQVKAFLLTFPGLNLHRESEDIREEIRKGLLESQGESQLETLATFLHYRLTVSAVTEKLLRVMDLSRYGLPDFHCWDFGQWLSQHGHIPDNVRRLFVMSSVFQTLNDIHTADLMIALKPMGYIAAALIRGGLSEEEIEKRLKDAENYMKKERRRTEHYVLKKLGKEMNFAG